MSAETLRVRPEHRQEPEPPAGSPDARLNGLLWTIVRDIDGIKGLVVSDPQGLAIASLARGQNTAAAAAMATLLRSGAAKVAAGLGLSDPTNIVIDTPQMLVLVEFLAGGYTLLAALSKDVNLGFARMELARYSADLDALIRSLR
jgi:predicted regulator of Ras-like GTPase activity (Roadblock/LC7/MglB family)